MDWLWLINKGIPDAEKPLYERLENRNVTVRLLVGKRSRPACHSKQEMQPEFRFSTHDSQL